MAAGKRRSDESYEHYRARLKEDEAMKRARTSTTWLSRRLKFWTEQRKKKA